MLYGNNVQCVRIVRRETSAVSYATRARKCVDVLPPQEKYKSLQIPSVVSIGTLSREFGNHFVVTSGLFSVDLSLSTDDCVVVVISIRVVSRSVRGRSEAQHRCTAALLHPQGGGCLYVLGLLLYIRSV